MPAAWSRLALLAAVGAGLVLGGAGCRRGLTLPTEEVKPEAVKTLAYTPSTRRPSPTQQQVLGNGWYANVEVDSQGRIHVAWTDADVGDVFYAVADRPGDAFEPQPVEVQGAVGSYLRLALAPGDVPVLAYYHQTERTLRLAHRPADLAAMKAAGAEVSAEGEPPPPLVEDGKPPAEGRMGPGWVGEDITFGDNVGMAGSLVVDGKGYPHIAYYARGERMRYARRPAGDVAFGPSVQGRFDLLDVDREAGASYTMQSDLALLEDGTVVVSFCHWNYVDAQLKVGWLRPGAATFQVLVFPMTKLVDGWTSSIVPRGGTRVDVYSVANGEKQLLKTEIDLEKPAVPELRPVVVERPGPAVVRPGRDGRLWVLTRGQGLDTLDEKSGMWLVEVPASGEAAKARRWLLDEGLGNDPWIDLALGKDGQPIAVWTTVDHRAMKLFAL